MPFGYGIGMCALRGHPQVFVLQFLQQLEESIRSESALVNSSRPDFSSSLFPCGMKPIIQKENLIKFSKGLK